MKIRSITSFFDPESAQAENELETLAVISQRLCQSIDKEDIAVQSTRLATTPFSYFFTDHRQDQQIQQAVKLEKTAADMGWAYLSLGPAIPEFPTSYMVIPAILEATQNVFLSAIMADGKQIFSTEVRRCAEIIHANALVTPDGFTNLRFAALANVQPWTPFLPAAYHQPGHPPAISIAIECADVVQKAFKESSSIDDARKLMLSIFEKTALKIEMLVTDAIGGQGVYFKGFDFSPAPFPEDWCSLGGAAEQLGLDHLGGAGSLTAVAIIAETLDRGNWYHAGFNGMMLPALEDSILSKRAAEGTLTVKDLLLYSAVCGTGLDTIPLAGDLSADQLASVLMDVAALSVRLAKPLTARLMPIPGKKAGEPTNFDFGFFSNSRIMTLDSPPLSGLLAKSSHISISPRKSQGKE